MLYQELMAEVPVNNVNFQKTGLLVSRKKYK